MEFAADLGRYLRHEPVLAHTPGKAYQLRKLVRRNRVLVTSGAAILLTLIAATVVSTREAVRAIRSERNAAASLKQSQQEAAEAQAVNAFLQEMLQSADPRAASKADPDKGRDVTVAHVLDEAVRRLDAGSLHNQPPDTGRRSGCSRVAANNIRSISISKRTAQAGPIGRSRSDKDLWSKDLCSDGIGTLLV